MGVKRVCLASNREEIVLFFSCRGNLFDDVDGFWTAFAAHRNQRGGDGVLRILFLWIQTFGADDREMCT